MNQEEIAGKLGGTKDNARIMLAAKEFVYKRVLDGGNLLHDPESAKNAGIMLGSLKSALEEIVSLGKPITVFGLATGDDDYPSSVPMLLIKKMHVRDPRITAEEVRQATREFETDVRLVSERGGDKVQILVDAELRSPSSFFIPKWKGDEPEIAPVLKNIDTLISRYESTRSKTELGG